MDTDLGDEYHRELFEHILFLSINDLSAWDGFTLAVLLFLLLCSALVSGSEVAFFSLDHRDIVDLSKDSSPKNLSILELLGRPKYLLSTILVANNFINVGIIVISTFLMDKLLGENLSKVLEWVISVGLVSFLLVLFGEVAPKVYARTNSMQLAYLMVGPLTAMKKLFHPLSTLLVKSTTYIEKRMQQKGETLVSMQDIDEAIKLTVGDKIETKQEIKLLKSIVNFGNVSVKQIMHARVDIVGIETGLTFQDILQIVKESGYSRIPVYTESLDNIDGFLYAKDLLKHMEKEDKKAWHDLLRPAFFVPETKKIDDLLKEFQTKRVHIAIVVDEYGGTAGLITLEDVLEEIIGEIKDEFDDDIELEYKKINEKNFLFEGKTMLNDVCRLVGINTKIFEKVRGDSDSLAGLMLELAGRMPKLDEELTYAGFIFKTISVDNRRIRQVKITLPESPVA